VHHTLKRETDGNGCAFARLTVNNKRCLMTARKRRRQRQAKPCAIRLVNQRIRLQL